MISLWCLIKDVLVQFDTLLAVKSANDIHTEGPRFDPGTSRQKVAGIFPADPHAKGGSHSHTTLALLRASALVLIYFFDYFCTVVHELSRSA